MKMKMKKAYLIVLSVLFIQCSLEKDTTYIEKVQDPEFFQDAMQNLTDIVVYDIFSPPVASRVYLYPTIAAYEVMALKFPKKYNSLVGQIKELNSIPLPSDQNINHHLASLYAFNTVGRALIFSEDKMNLFQETFNSKLEELNVPRKVVKASKNYGAEVAASILEWASKDMYNQTRTYPKYTIKEEDQFWKPTPPDYMDGIEPHWKEIRTMVIDSSNQFSPKEPLPFDMNEGSPFQKQLMEVFEVTNKLS